MKQHQNLGDHNDGPDLYKSKYILNLKNKIKYLRLVLRDKSIWSAIRPPKSKYLLDLYYSIPYSDFKFDYRDYT